MPPKKPTYEEKVVLELSSIKASINNLSTNLGKWLSAIALAAANPADNTAEVQKKLDDIAAGLTNSADVVESAIKEITNQSKES